MRWNFDGITEFHYFSARNCSNCRRNSKLETRRTTTALGKWEIKRSECQDLLMQKPNLDALRVSILLVVFSARGGISTCNSMPALTAYVSILASRILGKGGLFVAFTTRRQLCWANGFFYPSRNSMLYRLTAYRWYCGRLPGTDLTSSLYASTFYTL